MSHAAMTEVDHDADTLADAAGAPGGLAADLPRFIQRETVQLTIPSRLEWIEPAVDFLKDRALACGGCPASAESHLVLVFHEAITNAVVHGNLGVSSTLKEEEGDAFARALAERTANPKYACRRVTLAFDYDGERCEWVVSDEGEGFDVERVLAEKEALAEEESPFFLASGRGILLMKAFLDDVAYSDGGRTVTLTRRKEQRAEQRCQVRLAHQVPVEVAPIRPDGTVDWSAAYEAVSRNWSEGGLGLVQQNLTPGERLLLALPGADRPLYVPAIVRHWRRVGSNVMELGCEFADAPTPAPAGPAGAGGRPLHVGTLVAGHDHDEAVHAALTAILADHPHPVHSDSERRRFPRYAYTEAVQFRRAEALPGAPGTAAETGAAAGRTVFARDLSKGGLAFIASERFRTAPPERLHLRLPSRAGGEIAVVGEVVRCQALTETFFDVGVRFVSLDG